MIKVYTKKQYPLPKCNCLYAFSGGTCIAALGRPRGSGSYTYSDKRTPIDSVAETGIDVTDTVELHFTGAKLTSITLKVRQYTHDNIPPGIYFSASHGHPMNRFTVFDNNSWSFAVLGVEFSQCASSDMKLLRQYEPFIRVEDEVLNIVKRK